MDAEDFESALKAIVAGIRSTIRTEFTSIWLPIQLAAIGLAILIAIGVAAVIRKKFDLTSATMGWPAFLRLVVRALIGERRRHRVHSRADDDRARHPGLGRSSAHLPACASPPTSPRHGW